MVAPVRCGVLVISDRCYRKETLDESGPCIGELLRSSKQIQASVDVFSCVPDDVDAIQAVLKNWTDVLGTDLIITSGGTGFGVRDCTPEVQ
jgi:molybdenum cofactor synthesis domain-containing protein